MHLKLLLLSFFVVAAVGQTSYYCYWFCGYESEAFTAQEACMIDGSVMKNGICAGDEIAGTPFTKLKCYSFSQDSSLGALYPGNCGCPNNCFQEQERGFCSNGKCICAENWGGKDCLQPLAMSRCNPDGAKSYIPAPFPFSAGLCACQPDYYGPTCSQKKPAFLSNDHNFPPIPQVIPGDQYSDKDPFGDDNPVFSNGTIAQIHLNISEEDWAFMVDPQNIYNNKISGVYARATMWFYNGRINEVLNDVGMRIRGASSPWDVKKGWKLSFTQFSSGRRFHTFKKLNLKAMVGDNMRYRDGLGFDVLRTMALPSLRYSYAQVYINGISVGMYLLFEQADEIFLQSRYGTKKLPMYKFYRSTFAYEGNDKDTYIDDGPDVFGDYAYDARTPECEWNDLIEWFRVLNDPTTTEAELDAVMDIDQWIRSLCVEILGANWDGIQSGRNMYVINTGAGRFEAVLYDYDHGFGGDLYTDGQALAYYDIFTWASGGYGRVVVEKLMSFPSVRKAFANYMELLIEGYFRSDPTMPLVQRALAIRDFLNEPVLLDQAKYLDRGILPMYFWDAYTRNITDFSGSTEWGLTQYVSVRSATALQQAKGE